MTAVTDEEITQFSYTAQQHLHAFPQLVSGNDNPRHLRYVADMIQQAIERPAGDKDQLLMFTFPPRHGKTELISIHTPAWFLGRYPHERVILASYSAELATNNSSRAKDIFEEWGPLLFNQHPCPKIFNKTTWNTTKGGGVLAAGVEGPATGFGGKLVIIDDYLKDHMEAESASRREGIWGWWQSVITTRLHPGAVVVILATRWHDDDLIGRILTQEKLEGEGFPFHMKYVQLPALSEGGGDILNRPEGAALWPEREPRSRLLNKKKIVGSYWWSALFQCNPTARGGTLFKNEFFRYWTPSPDGRHFICYRPDQEPLYVNIKHLRRTAIVDLAIETKSKNDPTGMAAWAYSTEHKLWILLDAHSERIEHTKILERVKHFAFRNGCTKVLVENEKLGKVLVKQSAGDDKVGNVPIPFQEIPIKGMDKYARATPMANYIENGRVYFKRDAHWLAEYENELVKFPNAAHDEYVDITAYAESMETAGSVTEALAGLSRL